MIALDALRIDSLISYLIAILAPALDAILPVIPSETAVITLGVATAGSADPRIALLVLCAAFGAFLGDNLCYLLGRWFGPWIERRFFRGEKGERRRDWAERSLERYGMPLIIVCRFIPGGRTAVMLCCGIVRYDRRRFVIATAAAGLIWASYSFFIGRLGGKAFEDKPWAGLLLALGLTLTVSVIIEAIRRIRSNRLPGGRSSGRSGGRARSGRSGGSGGRAQGQAAAEQHDADLEQNGASSAHRDADPEQRGVSSAHRDADPEQRGADPLRRGADPLRRDADPELGVADLERRDADLEQHEPTGAGTAPSSETSGSH